MGFGRELFLVFLEIWFDACSIRRLFAEGFRSFRGFFVWVRVIFGVVVSGYYLYLGLVCFSFIRLSV